MPENKEQLTLFKVRDLRKKDQFKIDDVYLNGYARIFGVSTTAVYNSLSRHAEFYSQEAFPSEDLIAEEHNITARTVRTAIKKLKSANIIKIERSRKRGRWLNNVYYLVDKSEWLPPEEIKDLWLPPEEIKDKKPEEITRGKIRPTKDNKRKDNKVIKDNKDNIYMSYKNKINKKSILTSNGKKNIQNCRRKFTDEQILKAIDNKSKDTWFMRNNSNRGITWFFSSLARIARYIEEEPKKQLDNKIS